MDTPVVGYEYRFYKFTPKNPEKCRNLESGKSFIVVKSQNEWLFAKYIDLDITVVRWGYEVDTVPYQNPENPDRPYFIDFSLEMADFHEEWVEVKECHRVTKPSSQDLAKWRAATAYCNDNKISFVVFPNSIGPFMDRSPRNLEGIIEVDPKTEEPINAGEELTPTEAEPIITEPDVVKPAGFKLLDLIPKKLRTIIKN